MMEGRNVLIGGIHGCFCEDGLQISAQLTSQRVADVFAHLVQGQGVAQGDLVDELAGRRKRKRVCFEAGGGGGGGCYGKTLEMSTVKVTH